MKAQSSLRLSLAFYVLLMIIVGGLLLSFSKLELQLFVNEANNPFLDVFFKYVTYFGDGILYALLVCVLLFTRFADVLCLGCCAALQTLLVQVPKRLIFTGHYRPKKFFSSIDYDFHYVEGVVVHTRNSFPSGHTATAFALATVLSFMLSKRFPKSSMVLTLLAVLVAYSRVYLMQHFVIDVYVGSLLGVVSGIVVNSYVAVPLSKLPESHFWNQRLSLKGLLNRRRITN